VFALVYTEQVMMRPEIDNPTGCEIRAVMRFLHARSTSGAEIQRELSAVYCQNLMSEGTVRQWCRTNIHDDERCGGQILLRVLTNNFVRDGASHFQNFRVNFHKFQALFFTRLSQLG
jgi:hypothetical protein